MPKNVLLVGCRYTGPAIQDTSIDVLGLCRTSIDAARSAFALYDYDVIVINPASYSHFMFGEETKHSASLNELWDLKAERNDFDLDNAFDEHARARELTAAMAEGTRVVWLMQRAKHCSFFGRRTVFAGYVNSTAQKLVASGAMQEKMSRRLSTSEGVGEFKPFFDHIAVTGWSLCLAEPNESLEPFASSPEGCALGGIVKVGNCHGWILTPPRDQDGMNLLIQGAIGLPQSAVPAAQYHGIFLSHNSADKPFVRDLKARLETHGVKDVWLDEAEIMVGDSLTKKIELGLKKTKYIGVVLSPRSIASAWVERELEIAINREISSGEVVVLPLLYEKCELPSFLVGKLYADFTSPTQFDDGIEKLLRRLKVN